MSVGLSTIIYVLSVGLYSLVYASHHYIALCLSPYTICPNLEVWAGGAFLIYGGGYWIVWVALIAIAYYRLSEE